MHDEDLDEALDDSLRSLGAVEQNRAVNDELALLVARVADPVERHAMKPDQIGQPTTVKRTTAAKFGIGLIAGALVIGAGTVPAMAIIDWMARTGENAGQSTESHGGELIDLTAPDIDGFVNESYPQWLALPDAFSQAEAVAAVQSTLQNAVNDPNANPGGGQVLMEDVGIQRSFEVFALCGWLWEWRQADRGGDTQARDSAAAYLQDATTWPALVQTDGGGIIDRLQSVADAAAVGDSTPVSREYGVQMCSTFLGDTQAVRSKE